MSSITKISQGSLKELWKVSYPLMVAFLSTFTMLFVDRLFLAHYSPESLKACSTSGTLGWSLTLGWVTLATLSEVFVAQLNGAKKYEQLSGPVWQMIWLSIISILFFVPMGLYGSQLIYRGPEHQLEQLYFKWMMYTGPLTVLISSVAAFYIGQGKSKVTQWWAIIGNGINILLDPLFIFGFKGYIKEHGIEGAAIATFIAYAIQAACLFALFLSEKNRKNFNTADFTFKKDLMGRCLKVGLPPAIFGTLEVLAWAMFYYMMTLVSSQHILVGSICQSILMPFLFFGLGLEKGAAAVAGNLIGAGLKSQVQNVLYSGIKLVISYSVIIFFLFSFFSGPLIDLFLKHPEALESTEILSVDQLAQQAALYKLTIKQGLMAIGVYLLFENFRWLLSGMLTASGDTLFLMLSGTTSVWFALILPTFIFIVLHKGSVLFALWIWAAYSFLLSVIYLMRFLNGNWKEKQLIKGKE